MANNIFAHTREAVRVKVKKCEQNVTPEWRKFSVDPQITTLEVLYSLLAKAFDIKSDFSIKYKAFDPAGNETYLAVLSDWDLDAAFLRIHNLAIQTSTEPCLTLQIDIKPFTEVKEWYADGTSGNSVVSGVMPTVAITSSNVNSTVGGTRDMMAPLQQSFGASQKYMQTMQTRLPGLIMNQMEKTFSMVQKAFNLSEDTMASLPPRCPLADNEFRQFLDALGQIQRSDELRKVIFFGGIDPSLRRVVWKHILNVYPSGMNGHQRMDYMRRKSEAYYKLRDTWKTAIKKGYVVGEISYVTSMVKKDVLRTDRLHPFYAGSDDNQNIASLFNILTTFALNHPSVSYCQGMSDIASPLLVTMNDEAQAYICFCAIMLRVRGNFMLDGIAMTQKFAHLTEALSFYDPEFWDYLKAQQADDLLFCYRWLLLELKREFPFEDALLMLEVQWSSLKYESSSFKELILYEKEFVPIFERSATTTSSSHSDSLSAQPISPSYLLVKPLENPYTKICALRRQSSLASLSSLSTNSLTGNTHDSSNKKLDNTKRLNQSLDENISQNSTMTRRHRSRAAKAHQSLDETKMLMLMESAECKNEVKNQTDNALIENDCKDDTDDDEVFLNDADSNRKSTFHNSNSSISSSSYDTSSLHFLPTNPFIEDAKLDRKTRSANTKTELNHDKDLVKIGETNELDTTTTPPQIPKSISALNNKNILSNYNTVSNIIAKQIASASAVSENVKRVSSNSGGHFKDLKEKIAATSRRAAAATSDDSSKSNEKTEQKLVKNFNEFLNFASMNKNRISDKLTTTMSMTFSTSDSTASTNTINTTFAKSYKVSPRTTTTTPTRGLQEESALSPIVLHPLVKLTKSGFVSSLDDSEDSSSVPDTTWSCSTAATAIQQTNNLSSHSLQLDLNSPNSTQENSIPTSIQNENKNYASLTPEDSFDQATELEQEYYPMTTAITRELRLEAENLDRQIFGEPTSFKEHNRFRDIEYEKLDKDSLDLVDDLKENEIVKCPDISELMVRKQARTMSIKNTNENSEVTVKSKAGNKTFKTNVSHSLDIYKLNPFIDESILIEDEAALAASKTNSNSLPEVIIPISTNEQNIISETNIEIATNAADDLTFEKSTTAAANMNGAVITNTCISSTGTPTPPLLPPPTEFGGGNPFLMFLCLTLLLQHRNIIMKAGMDYNEIAMHFDKMVRKHDVTRVLNQARRMYIDYLKIQNSYKQKMQQAATGLKLQRSHNKQKSLPQQHAPSPSYANSTTNS